MNPFNWVYLIGFLCLCLPAKTRFNAAILFSMMLIYRLFVVNQIGLMYYGGAATLSTIAAVILFRDLRGNVLIAWLCACSVLANFYGWVIYEKYWEPWSYNYITLTITSLKLVVLMGVWRDARFIRFNPWRFMVRRSHIVTEQLKIKAQAGKAKKN